MDGVHDLGGKPGYGAVERGLPMSVDAPVPFEKKWHASVFAMVNAGAATGAWRNSDRFRHAVERIVPEAYLNHGYYGRWLGGLETLFEEHGVVLRAEIDRKVMELGGDAAALVAAQPKAHPDPMGPAPSGRGSDREVEHPPKFSEGDFVMTQAHSVPGHTRLPAYARGKQGRVVSWHGGWVFPDSSAHGEGEQPQHLYTVAFSSETLWGKSGFSVALDLFEPYLTLSDPAEVPSKE